LSRDKNSVNGSRLKVGVFFDGQDPAGGGIAFQKTLLKEISGTEWRHDFFLFFSGSSGVSTDRNIPLVNIGKGYSQGFVSEFLRKFDILLKRTSFYEPLEKVIRNYDIDVMWFLSPTEILVSIPSIYTVWDLQHRVNPVFPEVNVIPITEWAYRERIYNNTLPRAVLIFTGTETGREEIVHYYRVNPENVKVIPFPITSRVHSNNMDGTEDVRIKYNLGREYLFYPAQFWPHKNHANVLFAMDILRKEHSIHLDIVFTGSDKGNEGYIRELVLSLGLSSSVHFPGFIPDEDLISLYSNAFALLFASFFGPDNLPPLEAFSLGCPVIASHVPGSEEQLGDAALFFDPASPEDIASVVKTLFDNSELRTDLMRKGQAQLEGRSAKDYITKVNNALDDLSMIRHCWK